MSNFFNIFSSVFKKSIIQLKNNFLLISSIIFVYFFLILNLGLDFLNLNNISSELILSIDFLLLILFAIFYNMVIVDLFFKADSGKKLNFDSLISSIKHIFILLPKLFFTGFWYFIYCLIIFIICYGIPLAILYFVFNIDSSSSLFFAFRDNKILFLTIILIFSSLTLILIMTLIRYFFCYQAVINMNIYGRDALNYSKKIVKNFGLFKFFCFFLVLIFINAIMHHFGSVILNFLQNDITFKNNSFYNFALIFLSFCAKEILTILFIITTVNLFLQIKIEDQSNNSFIPKIR